MDDSIFALLASSDNDDTPSSYRELPPHQVWSDTALVDAWTAALGEFASASLSQSTGIPVIPLDREHQLLASPLWYAPFCPPSGSKPSPPSSSSKKRAAPVTIEEREEAEDLEEEHVEADQEQEEQYDIEEEEEEIIDNQVVEALLQPFSGPLQPRSHIHPSRLDHVKEHQPYIDPSEWQPVTVNDNSITTTRIKVTIQSKSTTSDVPVLAIPEPPAPENALPQDSALTDTQTAQEALEKALHAWYTAGYAAALYHIRSGLVKP